MRNSGYENTYLNHKFNPDPFIDSKWIISTLDNDIISSKENKITVLARNDISNLNHDVYPNVKIDVNQFCICMKGMARGDIDCIIFKVYENGLEIDGKNTNGDKTKTSSWGLIKGECFETKVDVNIIKALCKISGTTFYSIIKIFSKRNGEIRLHHKISDFGEHNIYLLDN